MSKSGSGAAHDAALRIVQKLQSAGYETYWVGGCVRDALFGVEEDDTEPRSER